MGSFSPTEPATGIFLGQGATDMLEFPPAPLFLTSRFVEKRMPAGEGPARIVRRLTGPAASIQGRPLT